MCNLVSYYRCSNVATDFGFGGRGTDFCMARDVFGLKMSLGSKEQV